jgi:3-phenylpropionate/trans-cinnamate dioxygenase ferredoxin reductase subunit
LDTPSAGEEEFPHLFGQEVGTFIYNYHPEDRMPNFRYLIVGGGMTASAALSGIRKLDPDGSIGLISDEPHPPYNRPPLSKGLWKGRPVDRIWRKIDSPGIEVRLGRKVTTLNIQQKRAIDNQRESYGYEKLLLATGGTPKRLPFGGENINYFRTLDDYYKLSEQAKQTQRFLVIGGGFIGTEITAALAGEKKNVMMVFPESGIGANIYPPDVSDFLNNYYREKGVEVYAGESIVSLEQRDTHFVLQTQSGKVLQADGVVAGLGLKPNTELAEAAGIKVDNGIVVDEFLLTSQPDIYAAGDVANFFNPLLGKRRRVEHEDNANRMGETAGKNMAASILKGEPERYDYLPFFYSDLFEIGYEAIGELNPSFEIVTDWEEPYKRGVIYYLDGKRVRGVLLWDVWGEIDAARDLLGKPGPISAQDLKGRLISQI